MGKIEERLAELGIDLGRPHKAAGSYEPAVISGNLLFVSGQGPRLPDGEFAKGKVGEDLTAERANLHARLCGIAILSAAQSSLGSLDRVVRVVKVLGMVNATPEFRQHPAVINGCSDLFIEVFGDAGKHARSAVGMNSLPFDISVEVEAIFEILPA